ncbi:MAG: HsdR family type I site-specific deoxyribonuclease [Saprospiraceae bacterium]
MTQNRHYIDEKTFVEEPFLEQLEGLGWQVLRLKSPSEGVQYPEESWRENFSQVIIKSKLAEALKQINPWLEDDQVEEVIRKLTTYMAGNLLENNKNILELLLGNTSVSENRKTGQKSPTVKYIDFEQAGNNHFLAVSQLKVRIIGTENHIYPDIILFVNGLPLVVIEAKSPKVKDPMGEAIEQLLRYSEQRSDAIREGNKELFFFNQILVATCRNEAKFGTITTHVEKHFYRWTDPYPLSVNDISTGASAPNDQQRLVAGMFAKQNLIELIRSFTIFKTDGNKTIKIVGRYQQFRAVKKILDGLRNGRNPKERGGILWHTQGSGKSLTMMFLVREMKKDEELKKWKIVFVTDRTDLEEQLTGTSGTIGFSVKVADRIRKLKDYIPGETADLVMAMIHKFQDAKDINYGILQEMNDSDRILVMTDEAHRTQYSILAANLQKAMPNATHIGFTGTPIAKTEKRYGDYIDKYTMRQAIEDGVTLEIVYEGRTHNAAITDKEQMNARFIDVFQDYDPKQQQEILGYATKRAYLEARETIKAKAEDMVDHYVEHIFANGFKAQIVATSREACVRYKEAVDEALKRKIEKLKNVNPFNIDIGLLEQVETDVVMSGGNNDEPHLKPYTDSNKHTTIIERFKLGYKDAGDSGSGTMGIVIVNNMLLTGFDAPIEQVMYLDRIIVAHNLLQAIARVNRVGSKDKNKGFIIDYVGVGHHLKEAILHYSDKEVAGVDADEVDEIIGSFSSETEEINDLIHAHKEVIDFIKQYGIEDLNDFDAFYDLFYDENIRFEFIQKFKNLSKAFDIVLPNPKALDYLKEYNALSELNVMAGRHFRDNRMSMKGVSAKLRAITDEYLISKGIDQKVPPLSILDDEFLDENSKKKRAKTKAAEIEHAIRSYIEEHLPEDPELYKSFAEFLERILEENQHNWDAIYDELKKFLKRIREEENKPTYGLHRKKQMPFYRLFQNELYDTKDLTEEQISTLVNLTQHLTNLLERELQLNGFWDATKLMAQNRLKGEIQKLLFSPENIQLPNMTAKVQALISRIMELAQKNNDVILYAD